MACEVAVPPVSETAVTRAPQLCINVEDDTVAELARCSRLRRVDMFGCTNITDDGVVALAAGARLRLREVNLGGMQVRPPSMLLRPRPTPPRR